MQLEFSFSLLLASVLVALSATTADARPYRRDAGMVTIPLKRINARSDVHPQLLFQQHLNRGQRRVARMTGRAEPSTHELRENLRKRMFLVDHPAVRRPATKRFNREGLHAVAPVSGAETNEAKIGVAGFAGGDRGAALHGAHADGGLGAGIAGAGVAGTSGSAGAGAGAGVAGAGAAGTSGSAGAGAGAGVAGAGAAGTSGSASAGAAAGTGIAGSAGGNAGTNGVTGSGSDTGTNGITGSGVAAGTNSTAGSASGAASTANGINPVDVQAAQDGGLTPAAPPTATDSLGLDIEANDVGYIGVVQIGTPPQNFNILMDSGSADFWVGSENCESTSGGGCGNHTFLGTQSSSSFVDTQQPFAVQYGSGSVSGDIVTDDVTVAGLALPAHSFGVANLESVDFSSDAIPFDGLMGLAQSTLSEQGVPTPIEALASSGAIGAAVTSFKLGRLADGNTGEVTFGGLDAAKFQANTLTTFANVNTQGFWEGAMTVSVGGQDLGLQGRTAILDTGTTLIIAPDADAQAVHAAIPGSQSDGQGGFTIPCTTNTSVALTFGGKQFAIDPRDLLFAPVDPTDLTGDCMSGISSGTVGAATEWLVGDVFLKNAYFSTDVGSNQISLAQLA